MEDQAQEMRVLREVVNHRGVVELLDLLAWGPHTVRELRSALSLRRPGVSRVLRVVAAYGLVTTDGTGSWDEPLEIAEPVRLTENGWRIVELLNNFAVWVELYEQSDS
ncbi:hypothetical protein OHB26_01050 [Nocardia sp. NBC_01503]|uniref:hypothetical protein n=1 Tax=Nocardia sp. NBC_01503 TaxID=2975997 RepID=UPI002E7B91B7|nr:hypothetical protein [Nocardia sp. NBC_01503]WTL32880.1 hypothetical protein OHB26_01050 [Nocardia sp. NBC_01503]